MFNFLSADLHAGLEQSAGAPFLSPDISTSRLRQLWSREARAKNMTVGSVEQFDKEPVGMPSTVRGGASAGSAKYGSAAARFQCGLPHWNLIVP